MLNYSKILQGNKRLSISFSRGIVYGEESSKSSQPRQITKISKNVRSRDQFKKYETKTATETETLNIVLETFITSPVYSLLRVNLTELCYRNSNEKRCCSYNFKINSPLYATNFVFLLTFF